MHRKRRRSVPSDEENKKNNLEKRIEKLEKENKRLKRKKQRKHRHRSPSSTSSDASVSANGCYGDSDHSRAINANPGQYSQHETETRASNESTSVIDGGDQVLQDITARSQPDNQQSSTVDTLQTVPSESNPEVTLSQEVLDIIGQRLCEERILAPPVHNDLVVRCEDFIKQGLLKEGRDELVKKYPPPSNCKSIDPLTLNPEFKAVVQDLVIKRDERIRKKQEKITTCLALAMQATSVALKEKDRPEMLSFIQYLYDLIQLLSDLQHDESMIRRSLVIANINAPLRDTVNATNCEKFLFGRNLEEVLKSAKSMESSVKDLKVVSKPQQAKHAKNSKFPPRQYQAKSQPSTSGGQMQQYQSSQKNHSHRYQSSQQTSNQKSRYRYLGS